MLILQLLFIGFTKQLPMNISGFYYGCFRLFARVGRYERSIGHTYLVLDKGELDGCIKLNNHYTCIQNKPTYGIDTETPCEIQMFAAPQTTTSYPIKYFRATHPIIIALENTNAWLIATRKEQMIEARCKNQTDYVNKISKIGLIQTYVSCIFTIDSVTIQTQERIEARVIQIYAPNFNLTLPAVNETRTINNNKISHLKK
ncbi:hypothetical protein EAI_03531 [Harpegnathos saltator]|uniref:Uncharacterized protein n=1 Tax=Harpegnathos saltator TaxID=610380 RepID=E2BQZ1_HARSA|nr:hypothetical protein EAI_03531 [Harpegnathos saltator]